MVEETGKAITKMSPNMPGFSLKEICSLKL